MPMVIQDTVLSGIQLCVDVILYNYGGYPHTISKVYLKNGVEFSYTYGTPKIIQPGKRDTVKVCFMSLRHSVYYDSLVVEGPCEKTEVSQFIYTAAFKGDSIQESHKLDCFTLDGSLFMADTNNISDPITNISCPDSSKINTNVSLNTNGNYFNSAAINASLQNTRQDGSFRITATDSIGKIFNFDYQIPGFTIGIDSLQSQTLPAVLKKRVLTGTKLCLPVILYNYGKFPQAISNVYLKNGKEFSYTYGLPKIIQPGKKDSVFVCFESQVDGYFFDSFIVAGPCEQTEIAKFEYISMSDLSNQEITATSNNCFEVYTINIMQSDTSLLSYTSVEVNQSVNCDIITDLLQPDNIELRIIIANKSKNAFYKFTVVDNNGNRRSFEDTLKAFPLVSVSFDSTGNLIDYGDVTLTDMYCRNLKIMNRSDYPVMLNNIFLARNVIFSVPQSQFPIQILPHDTIHIEICYKPVQVSGKQDRDTVFLGNDCGESIAVLKGNCLPFVMQGNSKCNMPISMSILEINSYVKINSIYPNPASGKIIVNFTAKSSSKINLKIYSVYGQKQLNLLNEKVDEGINDKEISIENLPSGLYFLEISTGTCSSMEKFVVY
jgi:hypothetical protein